MPEIGCAGILVADTFCGPMEMLPREGELLALDAMPSKAGGCAANVAICLSKQGLTADVVGRLGNDPQAQTVIASLERAGICCEHITFSQTQPSSQTVILLVRGQDRRYLHVFGANKEFSVSHIDYAWLSRLKVFYLGGLFGLPAIKMDELRDLLGFCRSKGIMTVVDVIMPQHLNGLGGLEQCLRNIDVFVPNEDEACQMTGLADPLDQLRALQRHGANTVIITRGEAGSIAVKGRDVWRSGTFPTAVIDPSGGGDAFTAGIIVGLLRGWDMSRMLSYASALGVSATRAVGTTDGVFTAAEAEAFLDTNSIEIIHEKLG